MTRASFVRFLSILGILTTTLVLLESATPIVTVAQADSLTDRYCGSPKDSQERFVKKINLEDGTFNGKPVTLSTSNWRDGVCIYILEIGNVNRVIHRFLNLRDRQSGQISQEFNGQSVQRIEGGFGVFAFADTDGKVNKITFTRSSVQATANPTNQAIAQPTNKAKGCLNSRIVTDAGIVRESYRVGNFVLNDGTGSSINVREKPTTKSSIQYVAPSRRGVSIFEQVVGTDDYCWIKVEGQIWDNGNTRPIGIFSGWVRGDFVKMGT